MCRLFFLFIGTTVGVLQSEAGKLSPSDAYLEGLKERHVCEYEKHQDTHDDFAQETRLMGNMSSDGFSVECIEPNHHCQVLWRFDPTNGTTTEVLLRGCWNGHSQDCEPGECVAYRNLTSNRLKNARWCCCIGSSCNANFTYRYDPVKSKDSRGPVPFLVAEDPWSPHDHTLTLMLVCGSVLITVVLFLFLIGYKWHRRADNSHKAAESHLEGHKLLATPSGTDGDSGIPDDKMDTSAFLEPIIDFSTIQLLDLINKGRYGSVYTGIASESGLRLAIKVYKPDCYKYYLSECTIFQLPNLEHENLLRFFGAKEMEREEAEEGSSLVREYWIAAEMMPRGTLHEFLKTHSVDWTGFLKMGYSVSNGLAYLHSSVKTDAGYKPAIAHRDINSRNILLKADGSCLICDFGFAMILEEQHQMKCSSHLDVEDGVSLPEVGTVRYMAPEVLEGAVNLRDPESALKQVDVYALGLVLWEMASRCQDLYRLTGHFVPEYAPPYSAQISTAHPTLEIMQSYVCRRKVRPIFPYAVYKYNHPVLRSLRELIEDCWDQDSEARITALCARERLAEMKPIHEYPLRALNPCLTVSELSVSSQQPQLIHSFEGTISTATASSGYGSLREGGTVSSAGGTSPCWGASDLRPLSIDLGSPTLPVQAYQGRNPCQERNILGFLHQDSSDDSSSDLMSRRVLQSAFEEKIDPCSPEAIARFLTGAKEKLTNQQKGADSMVSGYTANDLQLSKPGNSGDSDGSLSPLSEANTSSEIEGVRKISISQSALEVSGSPVVDIAGSREKRRLSLIF